MSFKVDCPDLSSLTEDEIISLIHDSKYCASKKARVKIIKILFEIFGFRLEPDLLYFLADNTTKQLCLAPAGGGKTTSMNAKLVCEKLYRRSKLHEGMIQGSEILCLVYNKHNVKDVSDRHKELVSKLKLSGIKGVDSIDDDLQVSTIHSFCNKWIQTYKAECGLVGFNILNNENSKSTLMGLAVKNVIKKQGYDLDAKEINCNDLLQLYNLMREKMLDWNSVVTNDKFIDLDLPVEFIQSVFGKYDAVKRRKNQYDYTDVLQKFFELISTNEEALERIRSNYEYYCVDEMQDLTPLIMEILKLLTKNSPLVCIGDDDQCIYPFRGADPQNILKFRETFPKGKVFLLETNRRCPSNVIDIAKKVINSNEDRFVKNIKSVKGQGNIEFISYRDRLGQIQSIINRVSAMSDDEKKRTCICYRNKTCSTSLVNMLVDKGVHFHVLSGSQPFDYGLYKAVFDVLQALQIANSKPLLYNLYKALPITKAEMGEALKYDPVKNVGTDGKITIFMENIDFGKKMNNQTFMNAWNLLKSISKVINQQPLKTYFIPLLNQIRKYHWNGVVEFMHLDRQEDNDFVANIVKYFSCNKTYREKYSEYEITKRMIQFDQMTENGVAVSTFHSLKGLEFDNVFIMDLQESLFPNVLGIEMKPYDDETKEQMKETETRLFYVAITRAKKNLYLYYSSSDPSIYVTKLLEDINKPVETKKAVSLLDKMSSNVLVLDDDDDDSNSIAVVEEVDDDNKLSDDFFKDKPKDKEVIESIQNPKPEMKPVVDFKQSLRRLFR